MFNISILKLAVSVFLLMSVALIVKFNFAIPAESTNSSKSKKSLLFMVIFPVNESTAIVLVIIVSVLATN